MRRAQSRQAQEAIRVMAALGTVYLAMFGAFVFKSSASAISPSLILHLGGSMADAGVQGAVVSAVAIAARLITGPLADRLGNKLSMQMGLALLAAGGFLLSYADDMSGVLVARAVQAIGIAAFVPSATALVSIVAPTARRGLLLGVLRLFMVLPTAFAPALFIDLGREGGFGSCFAILGGIAAAALLLVTFATPQDCGTRSSRTGQESKAQRAGKTLARSLAAPFRECPRAFAIVLVLAAIAQAGFVFVSSFSVEYLAHVAPSTDTSLFFALFGLSGCVINPIAGWVADRVNGRSIVAASMLLMGAGLASLAAAEMHNAAALAGALLVGIGKSGAAMGILALISAQISQAHRSTAMALQQSAGDIGAILALTLVGFAFDASGFSPAAVVIMAVIAAALLCPRSAKRRE